VRVAEGDSFLLQEPDVLIDGSAVGFTKVFVPIPELAGDKYLNIPSVHYALQ